MFGQCLPRATDFGGSEYNETKVSYILSPSLVGGWCKLVVQVSPTFSTFLLEYLLFTNGRQKFYCERVEL